LVDVLIQSCIYITFSRISEKDLSKEIGLKFIISILSPFLCKGFISENFNQERKIPDKSDLLHMYVKGDVIKGILTCYTNVVGKTNLIRNYDIFSFIIKTMVKINYIKMLMAVAGNAMYFVKISPKLMCIKCAKYAHTVSLSAAAVKIELYCFTCSWREIQG
jgi:hypothetical protein